MRYFKAVAECESMTKAAEQLHVSQPSLSKAVKGLEEEMGAPLFDRVGRRISLNENGRIVQQAVNHAIESVDSVPMALKSYVRKRSHVLNLLCPVPFGDDINLLTEFRRTYPDIRVRLCGRPDSDYDRESPDLTFFSSPILHTEPNFLMLGTESFVVSVANNHPLADKGTVSLAELSGEPFITVLPCRVRSTIEGLFEREGLQPRIVIEDQICWHINSLVANGVGFAVLPSITWFSQADRDRVSVLRICDCEMKRYIYLKWPDGAVLSDQANTFCHFVKGYFGRLCALYA